MADLERIKLKIRENLPVLREKYGISEIGLFGSYLHGLEKPGSDVDILVDFSRTISLLKFVALENEISALLEKKVDLVMKEGLKPRIGERILNEVEVL